MWFTRVTVLVFCMQVPSSVEEAMWKDDVRVLRWLADTRDSLEGRALALRKESIAEQVLALGEEDPSAAVAGVVALLHRLAPDRREAVIASLRREVLFGPHAVTLPGSTATSTASTSSAVAAAHANNLPHSASLFSVSPAKPPRANRSSSKEQQYPVSF